MVFTSKHKRLIIESYFRNGVFNNGEWTCSAVAWLTDSLNYILFYRKTMSELIIYFQHSAFVKLERNEVFSTFDLLAKIGGLFGLCTGASVITLVELIYYWSGRIICNVRLFGRWYGEKN
jgi:hypothetical protein